MIGYELAVAAVVTIGVATVITGGAILAGSSAGLAVFAATSLALIGVQTILKAITNANERAVLGTNVARNASTRSRVDRRSSEASSSGGGTPR